MTRPHLSDLSLGGVETRLLNFLERPWEKQHDPCDEIIARDAGLATPKIGMDRTRKRAWLAERLDAWIARTDRHSVEATRSRLPDVGMKGDPAMFDLMLGAGVNPHAMLLLAMTSNAPITCEIGDGMTNAAFSNMSVAPGEGRWFEIMVQLGPGVHWSGERLMTARDIVPETMLTLLEGRPLGEVVDHPALRDAGPIASVTTLGNGFVEMRVETDRKRPFREMAWRSQV
jgi:hypothetical protein